MISSTFLSSSNEAPSTSSATHTNFTTANTSNITENPQTLATDASITKNKKEGKLILFFYEGKPTLKFYQEPISSNFTSKDKKEIILPEIKLNEFLDLQMAANYEQLARKKYSPKLSELGKCKNYHKLKGNDLAYSEYIHSILQKLLRQGTIQEAAFRVIQAKRSFFENDIKKFLNKIKDEWSQIADTYLDTLAKSGQNITEECIKKETLFYIMDNNKRLPYTICRVKTVLFFINKFGVSNIDDEKTALVDHICTKMGFSYKQLTDLFKIIDECKLDLILTDNEKIALTHIPILHQEAYSKYHLKAPTFELSERSYNTIANSANETDESSSYFHLEDISYLTMDAADNLLTQAAIILSNERKNAFAEDIGVKLLRQGIKIENIKTRFRKTFSVIYRNLHLITKSDSNLLTLKLSREQLENFCLLSYYRILTIIHLLYENERSEYICYLMNLTPAEYHDLLQTKSEMLLPLLTDEQRKILMLHKTQLPQTTNISISEHDLHSYIENMGETTSQEFTQLLEFVNSEITDDDNFFNDLPALESVLKTP